MHRLILFSLFMWSFVPDCESNQLLLNSFRSILGALSTLLSDNFSSSYNSALDFSSHFIEFTHDILNLDTVGRGWGAGMERNNEASQNFSKTASPPKRHNASLWRLNVLDCLLENLEGRGRGGRTHVMFEVNLIVVKLIFFLYTVGHKMSEMWRQCVIYVKGMGDRKWLPMAKYCK